MSTRDEELVKQLPPEDSTFVPEIEYDPESDQIVDVNTKKKYRKPFEQKPWTPLTEYGG